MTERTAHLVDEVLPWVPVRQWVLTVPYRLRYLMAWDHGLSRAVLGVYARVLLDVYARGARERGLRDGRTGTVTAHRLLARLPQAAKIRDNASSCASSVPSVSDMAVAHRHWSSDAATATARSRSASATT
jgi:hypothetical protein